MQEKQGRIFRNVCPRNCYDSCAMLSHVQNGKLEKVEGDPLQEYTQGRLCSKGYAYTDYVYNENRIRYPLLQSPRGSGNWKRIGWDQALDMTARKMIELKERYGSNLALAYNKGTGNIGLLHYAVEGMFNSLGAHTKPIGDPCLAAGKDALFYDYGQAIGPDPESMQHAQLIVIWGANPAWTAVHQMDFINRARDRGAKLVVIDPVLTATAAKADLYIQIQPGTDGLLALTLAKIIIERNEHDIEFTRNYLVGWDPFQRYLDEKVSLAATSAITGVSIEAMNELAALCAAHRPGAHWVGYGLQRHENGGQNVRAVSALCAITGNIGLEGGGLFYLHPAFDLFPLALLNLPVPLQAAQKVREVDINNFAESVLSCTDPPVKLLWIANRNPLSQDQELGKWRKLLQTLEFVVTVDLYMTETAQQSDLVLPAASHFEELDVNVSYWHYWLALNEKTLPAYFEAKSDLAIARLLTRRLNELAPGFSSFPYELEPEDWLQKEFTPEVLGAYGLSGWEDLKFSPRRYRRNTPWYDKSFQTESKKMELFSEEARKHDLPAIARFNSPKKAGYPLRLLTPQSPYRIHSQNTNSTWLGRDYDDIVNISPQDASARGLAAGDRVKIYNAQGAVYKRARISAGVPRGIVVAYQGGKNPINTLIAGPVADMGMKKSRSRGVAFYDIYVECIKADD